MALTHKLPSITPGQRHKYEPSFETIFSDVCRVSADIKLEDFQKIFQKMSAEEQIKYIKEKPFLKAIYDVGFQDGWDYCKEVRY